MGVLLSHCETVEPEIFHNVDPTVTLHIYDLAKSSKIVRANRALKMLGTGAFHGAVEVYGPEWSYGGCDEGTGVFSCPPKSHEGHNYRESIPMGETTLRPEQVEVLIDRMSEEWAGQDYDLLRHNCCNFSDDLCQELGVGPIPRWVVNLAGAGATLADGTHKVESTAGWAAGKAKYAAIIAAAKAGRIHGKYLHVGSKARQCYNGGSQICCGSREGKESFLAERCADRPGRSRTA